jgi:hypothetical protein
MRVHSARKLFLFGRYSLALLLPKKWLTELTVERGDLVTMEYDRRRARIILRFSEKPASDKPAVDKLPTALNRDDLEPITQIQN